MSSPADNWGAAAREPGSVIRASVIDGGRFACQFDGGVTPSPLLFTEEGGDAGVTRMITLGNHAG